MLLSTLRNSCCSLFLSIQVSTAVWFNDWEESYTFCGPHFQTRVGAFSWLSKFQPMFDSMTERKVVLSVVHISKLVFQPFRDHPSFNLCVIQWLRTKSYFLWFTLPNSCCSPFPTIQVSTSVWFNDSEESYTFCGAQFQTCVVTLFWPPKFQPLCDSITEPKVIISVVHTSKWCCSSFLTIQVSTCVWLNHWKGHCMSVVHISKPVLKPFPDHPSLNLCVIQLLKRKFYVLSSTRPNLCCSPFLTIQVWTCVIQWLRGKLYFLW